jgi:quinol monooxygenase YgiN
MPRFAQHSRIRARAGKRDDLVAKFTEVAVIQRDNPACELSLVSTSPEDDVSVFLTEVWASAEEHERARQSPEVEAWAADMPSLVDGAPETTPLEVVGGKGLPPER